MLKSNTAIKIYIILPTAAIFALIFASLYPQSDTTVHAGTTELNLSNIDIDEAEIKVSPSSIAIPSLGLEVPVAAGEIYANQWTLFEDKASWLSTSEEPGLGNVIIYAHNRQNLFGNLSDVAVGDEIVLDHQGKLHSYLVSKVRKVTPGDVDAVLSEGDQLTLYTCDGTFDEKRLIVTAKPYK